MVNLEEERIVDTRCFDDEMNHAIMMFMKGNRIRSMVLGRSSLSYIYYASLAARAENSIIIHTILYTSQIRVLPCL